MKAKENSQRRGNQAHNAPEHNVVIVELNDVHFVLFHTERFQQPQAHVYKDEQGDQRPTWFQLFNRTPFRVHFQAVYDQNALSSRFDYGKHLNAE